MKSKRIASQGEALMTTLASLALAPFLAFGSVPLRTSHVGKLDKAWDEAVAKGWTVVSMKDDWKTIFPK
jgi:hypothetical protein